METCVGTVVFFNNRPGKQFGFIDTGKGTTVFFHKGNFVASGGKSFVVPKKGDAVEYTTRSTPKGPKAAAWWVHEEVTVEKVDENKVFVHPKIAELYAQLTRFTDKQLDNPTKEDRAALMILRYEIKNFFDEDIWTYEERTDLQYLYVESTLMANRQEDFYEKHNNKWANEVA